MTFKDYFETQIPEFQFNADLSLSENAQDYLDKYLEFRGFSPKLFEFNGAYYYSKPQHKGQSFFAVQVSDFTVETDFFLVDDSIKEKLVYRYGLTIHPQGRDQIHTILDPKEISTAKDLTTSMLTRARCSWSGDVASTHNLCTMIVQSGVRELRQLKSVGYDESTNSYVFSSFMIDPGGKMVLPDKKGLFSLPGNHYIRPAQFKSITPVPGLAAKDMWSLLFAAWGDRAAAAASWVVASWFVEHIRRKTGFFPFLSLYHDPQVGKSALMRCLNRMQCINEEGLTMTKADTIKGLTRKLSQKASLFVVLSEINRAENYIIPIDSILSWYDGSNMATRGEYTNGNEVVEVPFKCSLTFCQNREPFTTPPQKQRVISLKFEKERLTPDTKTAFLKLRNIPIDKLAHFFVQVMASRKMIESSWFEEFSQAGVELHNEVETSNRLVETHSLVLAFHRILCRIIGIDYDLKPYIIEILKEKHVSSSENEANPGETFFMEAASLLRTCIRDKKRHILQFINVDSKARRLWVHPYELVSYSQPSPLTRQSMEKIIESLKSHEAFIKRGSRRFKYIKESTMETIVENKKGYCFDIDKLGDEFDSDMFTSLNS